MTDDTTARGITWDLNDLYAAADDPRIVADLFQPEVTRFLAKHRLAPSDIAQFIFHYDLEAAAARAPKADPALSMQLVFLVSVVNGIFEELFVAGYIITALAARRGLWMAINVSVVVRLLYHLYQGPIGVLTSVPMGLLYGYLYSRTRQLWPLIVAHVLLVLVTLSMR